MVEDSILDDDDDDRWPEWAKADLDAFPDAPWLTWGSLVLLVFGPVLGFALARAL